MASEGFHEDVSRLRPETLEMHRAITSLMEEIQAVDWYNQRVDASADAELPGILAHNRDEEKEHAAMLLEWIRRRDPAFDRMLRQYLFTEESIVEIEGELGDDGGGPGGGAGQKGAPGTLGVGSLRDEEPNL